MVFKTFSVGSLGGGSGGELKEDISPSSRQWISVFHYSIKPKVKEGLNSSVNTLMFDGPLKIQNIRAQNYFTTSMDILLLHSS